MSFLDVLIASEKPAYGCYSINFAYFTLICMACWVFNASFVRKRNSPNWKPIYRCHFTEISPFKALMKREALPLSYKQTTTRKLVARSNLYHEDGKHHFSDSRKADCVSAHHELWKTQESTKLGSNLSSQTSSNLKSNLCLPQYDDWQRLGTTQTEHKQGRQWSGASSKSSVAWKIYRQFDRKQPALAPYCRRSWRFGGRIFALPHLAPS